MSGHLTPQDVLGLIHPAIDIHTLGISSVAELLESCGVQTVIAEQGLCLAIEGATPSTDHALSEWVKHHGLTALGFSYRLDPGDGAGFFRLFVAALQRIGALSSGGGPIREVYFAGLPATCEAVIGEYPWISAVFSGDETPSDTLSLFGLDKALIPTSLLGGIAYDDARWQFAVELIQRGEYRFQTAPSRSYPSRGTTGDRLIDRLLDGKRSGYLPLMRAHVGAYLPSRREAVELNLRWAQELAATGFLDILSVGSSQLTQSSFFEEWTDQPNGGGVPLQTEAEFAELWQAARPMLVRAYSGTRDIVRVAQMLESNIHIAWHALSLWWFCQIDGRGPNTVKDNLKEHWDTLRYIASTGKPFEPNIPHHFAFRGGDDVAYVVSGYLAAQAAQRVGIRDFVLQVMLNTPKATWGIQDLAKARVLLHLVRSLEHPNFRVHLQPRGGLDYFSPNEEKAKIQLAAATALMDDIEPRDHQSPAIIHVVSYSEATHLADPSVVDESIQITRQALKDWRALRRQGKVPNMAASEEVDERFHRLLKDCQQMIQSMESLIPDLYTPDGFYKVLEAGYFPVPFLWECRSEFAKAIRWRTKLHNGGVTVIDEDGTPLSMNRRLDQIEKDYREVHRV